MTLVDVDGNSSLFIFAKKKLMEKMHQGPNQIQMNEVWVWAKIPTSIYYNHLTK